MLTNKISLADMPPKYSTKNLNAILDRVKILYPSLQNEGAELFVCDLFAVNKIGDIKGEFLTYEELEPAISSQELNVLASRIVAYCNGDVEKSIYSVRNVLNSLPKSLDDLVDYITEETKENFISRMHVVLLMENGDSGGTQKKIEQELSKVKAKYSLSQIIDYVREKVDVSIVDVICDIFMQEKQEAGLESFKGITDRQKMLSMAAVYYLNHLVGFKRNSIWLAGFIQTQRFGCNHGGWLHDDGHLCHGRDFGFTDNASAIGLVYNSLSHVEGYFVHADIEEDPEYFKQGIEYTRTMILALENIIKFQSIEKSLEIYKNEKVAISSVLGKYFVSHKKLFSKLDQAKLILLNLVDGSQNRYLDDCTFMSALQIVHHTAQSYSEDAIPAKNNLTLFDLLNWSVCDIQKIDLLSGADVETSDAFGDGFRIAASFVDSGINTNSLISFAEVCINTLSDRSVSTHVMEMSEGFLTHYLRMLMIDNTENQYMFDQILEVTELATAVVSDKSFYPNLIREMAELGHPKSMSKQLLLASSKEETNYWKLRVNYCKEELCS